MRLSLSHPRSPNAVYLLLNNLLQQEQPGRQNLGRVCVSFSQLRTCPGDKNLSAQRGESVYSAPFPFLGRQSFWNFPWDVLKKMEFLRSQSSFNTWAWSRVRLLEFISRISPWEFPEFIPGENSGHKNPTHSTIPRRGSQHPGTAIPFSIREQL